MRYLSKQFETSICQSYRSFLTDEWEDKKCSDIFCVNYGLGRYQADEKSIREMKSLAAQLGKKRIVAELPSVNAENIAKFYLANGSNQMCFQKRPQEEILEYYMRLGYFLGEGTETVNVAILEPDKESCRMLSKRGIAYHILTNIGMMKYGFVKNSKIGCGGCIYDYLVLPSEVVLNRWTKHYVTEFVQQGGQILLLGEQPVYMDSKEEKAFYLESTCTFGTVIKSQAYRCKNPETEIYTTFCHMNEMQILYVVNASSHKIYEQSFDFGEKVHSFLKLNLMELTTEVVPLTITLQPGADSILIPYARKIAESYE